MKKTLTLLVSALILLSIKNSTAQTNHPFELGLNFGASWLKSDVKMKKLGGAGGLTFGQMYYENKTSPIDWGWRLRYLSATTYGQDSKKSYGIAKNNVFNGTNDTILNYYSHGGYVYQNYKTSISEFSLELILGANKLREKTKIYPYIFGGVGLTKAIAKTDQLNANNKRYDYAKIDSAGTAGSSANIGQLNDLLDGNYETISEGSLNPQWKFMPSVGVGIGYQFTKGFSMGLEHKITWALNDVLDGQQWLNTNVPTGNNDMYHYSSVWLKFSFGRKEKPTATTTTTTTTNNYTTPVTPQKPIVVITNPQGASATSQQKNFSFAANVKNVTSKSEIVISYNGISTSNFSYDANTHNLTFPVLLNNGSNSFIVTATNSAGSISASANVFFNETVVNVIPSPIVTIAYPGQNPFSTNQGAITITGSVQNVTSKNQIQISVNGSSNSNFTFNPTSKTFSLNTSLIQGANTFLISASNQSGNDSKSITVIFKQDISNFSTPLPIITISSPNTNPYNCSVNAMAISASIQNITSPGQIAITINNGPVPASKYNYNLVSKQLTFNADLIQGANSIIISATNVSGADSKTQTIIYTPVVAMPKPIITITSPTTNPFSTNQNNATVKASVQNVNSKNDISIIVNGISTSNFSYNSVTKTLSISTNLILGSNAFVITATNQSGNDSKNLSILYQTDVHLPKPVITFITPSTNPFSTNQSPINFLAKVIGVNSKNDITLKVNGNVLVNFTYNNLTKELTINQGLILGANTFVITASNASGSVSEAQVINYSRPAITPHELAPIVSFIAPSAANSTSNAILYSVTANVLNVPSASNISVKFNGVPLTNFSYQVSTNKLTFKVSLILGNNSIVVSATNSAGTDSKTVTITRTALTNTGTVISHDQIDVKPFVTNSDNASAGTDSAASSGRVSPVIKLISPSTNSATTTSSLYTITLKLENVLTAAGVIVKINGTTFTGFSFNNKTKNLSIPANLNMGTNTIVLVATNAAGSKTETYTIIRQ